jgi:hypothetical protein
MNGVNGRDKSYALLMQCERDDMAYKDAEAAVDLTTMTLQCVAFSKRAVTPICVGQVEAGALPLGARCCSEGQNMFLRFLAIWLAALATSSHAAVMINDFSAGAVTPPRIGRIYELWRASANS